MEPSSRRDFLECFPVPSEPPELSASSRSSALLPVGLARSSWPLRLAPAPSVRSELSAPSRAPLPLPAGLAGSFRPIRPLLRLCRTAGEACPCRRAPGLRNVLRRVVCSGRVRRHLAQVLWQGSATMEPALKKPRSGPDIAIAFYLKCSPVLNKRLRSQAKEEAAADPAGPHPDTRYAHIVNSHWDSLAPDLRAAWAAAAEDRRPPGQQSLHSILGSQPTGNSSPGAMEPAVQGDQWVQQLPQGMCEQYFLGGAAGRRHAQAGRRPSRLRAAAEASDRSSA